MRGPRRDLGVPLSAEREDLAAVLGHIGEDLAHEVVRRRDAARERIVRERLAQNRETVAQAVVVRAVAGETLVGRECPPFRWNRVGDHLLDAGTSSAETAPRPRPRPAGPARRAAPRGATRA